MVLINTRIYNTHQVLTEGQCALCTKQLNFSMGMDSSHIFTECCKFMHILHRIEPDYTRSIVEIKPITKEKND